MKQSDTPTRSNHGRDVAKGMGMDSDIWRDFAMGFTPSGLLILQWFKELLEGKR
jgi:hypothetical protein